jgi:hypothetical protein
LVHAIQRRALCTAQTAFRPIGTLNTAVVAPMPIATFATATTVNEALRTTRRKNDG